MKRRQDNSFLFRPAIPVIIIGVVLLLGLSTVVWTEEIVVSPDADGVQRATMTVDSHFYKPDHLVVRVGTPIELTLVSQTTFSLRTTSC